MRFRILSSFLLLGGIAHGAQYTLTLRQAVDKALEQNPELLLARFDEQKAALNVRLLRDPFYPKLYVGSGAAYTFGYPLTINGSPPSIFQSNVIQTLYNRTKTYQVAEARENARTASVDTQAKRDDVAYRTASLYLDVERVTQLASVARRQVDEAGRLADAVSARVAEGRLLEVESDAARADVLRAQQRARALIADQSYLERSLAIVLGYSPEDSVRASGNERSAPILPNTEQEAVEMALANNREIKRLESVLISRGYALKAQQAARLPQIDLVAQYSLLTRYNFNPDFFGRFNRNAGQLGVSIQIPVLAGTGAQALAEQAVTDISKIREEIRNTQGRISLDARRSFEELRNAESAEEVARVDLAVSRKRVDVLLARSQEGRASAQELAAARTVENERWSAYYEAQTNRERARLNLLRQTGSVLAALR